MLARVGAALAPILEPSSLPVPSAPPIALIHASDFPSVPISVVVDLL